MHLHCGRNSNTSNSGSASCTINKVATSHRKTEQITPKQKYRVGPNMIRESNFIVVPIAKKVITIIAGKGALVSIFADGKKLLLKYQ